MRSIEEFLYWEEKSKDTIDFKVVYVDVADDLIAGLLLSQIIYWNLPSKKGQSKIREINGRRQLVKQRGDWYGEIRITEKQYDRAIGILEKKGLVNVENHKSNFYGGAVVPHIELLYPVLLAELNNQRVKAELPKGQSQNYRKVNPRITERSIAIDTESTSESTSEIMYKEEELTKNPIEKEVVSELRKIIEKNSSSPNIKFNSGNRIKLQDLLTKHSKQELLAAVDKLINSPNFHQWSIGGILQYVTDILYQKKQKQDCVVNKLFTNHKLGQFDGTANTILGN